MLRRIVFLCILFFPFMILTAESFFKSTARSFTNSILDSAGADSNPSLRDAAFDYSWSTLSPFSSSDETNANLDKLVDYAVNGPLNDTNAQSSKSTYTTTSGTSYSRNTQSGNSYVSYSNSIVSISPYTNNTYVDETARKRQAIRESANKLHAQLLIDNAIYDAYTNIILSHTFKKYSDRTGFIEEVSTNFDDMNVTLKLYCTRATEIKSKTWATWEVDVIFENNGRSRTITVNTDELSSIVDLPFGFSFFSAKNDFQAIYTAQVIYNSNSENLENQFRLFNSIENKKSKIARFNQQDLNLILVDWLD